MTDTPIPAKLPARYYKGGGLYWVKRLNVLLRFTRRDLAVLTNGAWQDLLDELYWAMQGSKRNRRDKKDIFNRTATRESVREAQLGLLERAIDERTDDDLPGNAIFDLAKHQIHITHADDVGFCYWIESEHFPTMVYWMFAYLLNTSFVRLGDFRHCGNDKCGLPLVPLRKPRKGQPAYCSPKCSNRMAAIKYRKNKGEKLKAKERVRSNKRYRKKVGLKS